MFFSIAQCNKPMIPNSNSTSTNPLIDHGGAIVVRCDDGYYIGESDTSTSVCIDGTLDPVVPFCHGEIMPFVFINSVRSSQSRLYVNIFKVLSPFLVRRF